MTDYVYHSEPYGIPIDTEVLPWLESPKSVKKALDGQVRILFDPELFTSGNLGDDRNHKMGGLYTLYATMIPNSKVYEP